MGALDGPDAVCGKRLRTLGLSPNPVCVYRPGVDSGMVAIVPEVSGGGRSKLPFHSAFARRYRGPFGFQQLAQRIVDAQQPEIARMETWVGAWFGDGAAPAP